MQLFTLFEKCHVFSSLSTEWTQTDTMLLSTCSRTHSNITIYYQISIKKTQNRIHDNSPYMTNNCNL